MRAILEDYAVTIGVVVTTLLSYTSSVASPTVLRIRLPKHFSPSCRFVQDGTTDLRACHDLVASDSSYGASVERPWLAVGMGAAPSLSAGELCQLWLLALIAAVPISFFFFFDQNISCLVSQREEGALARGTYMHGVCAHTATLTMRMPYTHTMRMSRALTHELRAWRAGSFVALGALNLFGPLAGLPFVTGSLPRAPEDARRPFLEGVVPPARASS